jgi:hypothetical protein
VEGEVLGFRLLLFLDPAELGIDPAKLCQYQKTSIYQHVKHPREPEAGKSKNDDTQSEDIS